VNLVPRREHKFTWIFIIIKLLLAYHHSYFLAATLSSFTMASLEPRPSFIAGLFWIKNLIISWYDYVIQPTPQCIIMTLTFLICLLLHLLIIHRFKSFKYQSRTDLRKNSFSRRLINSWNNLPGGLLMQPQPIILSSYLIILIQCLFCNIMVYVHVC